jgi:hypothetical protein
VTLTAQETDAAAALRSRVNGDGGYAPTTGPSEPEPTALAALALPGDDTGGRAGAWLRTHQRPDGTWAPIQSEPHPTITPTALAALATPDAGARDRAVGALIHLRAPMLGGEAIRGWGWTPQMFGWVEPTAFSTLALKRLRPAQTALIEDGERLFADRECAGGGWNYGNRSVYGENLPPYVETTAAALFALQGTARHDLVARGLAQLTRQWPQERGGLSLAMTVVALRLSGAPFDSARRALLDMVSDTIAFGDNVALAWTVIALAPDLAALQVAPT